MTIHCSNNYTFLQNSHSSSTSKFTLSSLWVPKLLRFYHLIYLLDFFQYVSTSLQFLPENIPDNVWSRCPLLSSTSQNCIDHPTLKSCFPCWGRGAKISNLTQKNPLRVSPDYLLLFDSNITCENHKNTDPMKIKFGPSAIKQSSNFKEKERKQLTNGLL